LASWSGPSAMQHTRIPIREGICRAAVSEKATVIVPDVNNDPRYLQCFINTRAEIVVPILRDGAPIAEIDIDSDQLNAFGPTDKEFLEWVADDLRSILCRSGVERSNPSALEPELAPDPNERIDLVRGRELVRGHEAGDGFRIQDAIASILRLRAVDDSRSVHFLEVVGEGGRRDRHLFQDHLVRGVLPLHEEVHHAKRHRLTQEPEDLSVRLGQRRTRVGEERKIVRSRPFKKKTPKAPARNTRCPSRVRRNAITAMRVRASAKTETIASKTFSMATTGTAADRKGERC